MFAWIGGENPQPELRSVSVIGSTTRESHPKYGMPRHCSLARSGGFAWLGAAVSVRP